MIINKDEIEKFKSKTLDDNSSSLSNKTNIIKKSASSNYFKFIWFNECKGTELKPHNPAEGLYKEINPQHKFFKYNDSLDYIFDEDYSSEEYENPKLYQYYKEKNERQKYRKALTLFSDKTEKRINIYFDKSESNIFEFLIDSLKSNMFISRVKSLICDTKIYKNKHKNCKNAYNDFVKNLGPLITTRHELLSLLLEVVQELNKPTRQHCNTGFEILNESLKEADLDELTSHEINSIKQGILVNDDNSFYPIII